LPAAAQSLDLSRRTCVVTGLEDEPAAMLRFALSPEGVVTPDILRKLPGRGVWTRLNRATVAQAARKQAFSRGFRKAAKVDAGLADQVDRLLEQDALAFLSLVKKAGLVVTGAMKVEAAIRAGRLVALVHATDGAPDGGEKLERLLFGVMGERESSVQRINLFSSAQLDLALGKANVIHAALNAGPASAAFLVKVFRLARYRADETTAAASADAEARVATSANADRFHG
jgi:predicted RNA-binding protein YlxR (DUF448 family)